MNLGKVVMISNDVGAIPGPHNRKEHFLNNLLRTYWRASLVPAAAVIPQVLFLAGSKGLSNYHRKIMQLSTEIYWSDR